MSKITYEVKEEKGDDSTGHIIAKRGAEITFTLADMLGYQEKMHTMLTETRGQLDYEISKMKNVEHHHDDAVALVKGLDPVKQKAIQIWLSAKINVDTLGPHKDQLVDALRQDLAELDVILEQTGLSLPENYKPIDLNGTPKVNTEESEEGDDSKKEAFKKVKHSKTDGSESPEG